VGVETRVKPGVWRPEMWALHTQSRCSSLYLEYGLLMQQNKKKCLPCTPREATGSDFTHLNRELNLRIAEISLDRSCDNSHCSSTIEITRKRQDSSPPPYTCGSCCRMQSNSDASRLYLLVGKVWVWVCRNTGPVWNES
jgi:hypothetical protein